MGTGNGGKGIPMDAVTRLEDRLLAAHENGDSAALSVLYREAADAAEEAGERDRAAFFLTHAWVFALDAGMSSAESAHATLVAWGRDI